MDKYYTIKQVADIWGVCQDLVRDEIKNNNLKHIRIGNNNRSPIRIYQKELDRYMAEKYEKNQEK